MIDPYLTGYGLRFPRSNLISLIFKSINFSQPIKILDIGCGLGANADILKIFQGTYLGIDLSENAISKAANIYQNNSNISFKRSDIREFFRNNEDEFNIVIDSSTLQHVQRDDIPAVIKEISNHINRQPSASMFFSNWASDTNSNMDIRFESFTGFELIINNFQENFEELEIYESTFSKVDSFDISINSLTVREFQIKGGRK
jgi:2-polyprenyl-3-methyl-5-hydroxy-6-metoxy-1,4-benzoquinol methylase